MSVAAGSIDNMCMGSKYCPIIDILPEIRGIRKKIIFRIAGDGFLQIEYGDEQVFDPMDAFRLFTVIERLKKEDIPGVISYGQGFRTLTVIYDPSEVNIDLLIKRLKEMEESISSPEEMYFSSRIIRLPIVFKDSATTRAIEYYRKVIRNDAPNIIEGHNFKYVAMYNGLTEDELKQKILQSEWLLVHQLFWPGGTYQLPLDPRSAIEAPKYNPTRTYTPEGAVGIGGQCLYIYTTESPGGYQLLGRTIPTYQISQKHPAFKEKPFLLQSSDRIVYYEISEDKLLEIYELVHEEGSSKYIYSIEQSVFKVKDWLNFVSRADVRAEVEEFMRKKKEAQKSIQVP
jgi:urea carboxylase